MADVTGAWRACLAACKRAGGGGGGGGGRAGAAAMLLSPAATSIMPGPAALGAGSSGGGSGGGAAGSRRVADPLTQQAQEVLEGIRAKEELLARSREDYVDAYRFLPSRASDMTDQERDQIDQLMASFIIKCGSQIEIIRCALAEAATSSQAAAGGAAAAGVGEQGSRLAHYGGLVAYLAERLQDLGQTLQGLQAQRRKLSGMAPGGAGGKGGPTGLAAAAAARSRRRMLGQSSRGADADDGPPSPLARMAAGATGERGRAKGGRLVMAQSQGEVAEEEAFARRLAAAAQAGGGSKDAGARRQKQLMLEHENRLLTARLNNELQEVRMMEGKMVELSQLLGLFTGKLMEQQDQVGEIFEAAASANVNVEQANDELLTTLERNSKASQTMLTFVLCLCLGLLLLDQLVP